MKNKTFWRNYSKWEKECKKEMKEKGYNPKYWYFDENGRIYLKENSFFYVDNICTSWKNSIYFVE